VPLGKMQQAFRLTTNMMTMVMTMTLKMTRMVMMTRTRHDDDDNDDINLLILQLVHFVVNGMTAEVQCLASENLDCLRTLLVSTEYCLVEWYWPLEIARITLDPNILMRWPHLRADIGAVVLYIYIFKKISLHSLLSWAWCTSLGWLLSFSIKIQQSWLVGSSNASDCPRNDL